MSGNKTSSCPECGKHASGNFCHHCGSTLGGKFCNQCGAEITGEGKFCNQCGATVPGGSGPSATGGAKSGGARGGGASRGAAAAAGANSTLPWWVAGAAMFGLILVVGWNAVQPGAPPVPGGGAPAGAASTSPQGTTDISQMSPREAADRLFNRVMEAASAGDSTSAQGFMPMALQAYEMAQPLDMDGLFHVALLQVTAGQLDAALTTAQQMLETEANHILALGAAAAAAAEMGDAAQARAYHQQILDNYDVEAGRQLVEYQGHTNYLESARSEAQAFLAGG